MTCFFFLFHPPLRLTQSNRSRREPDRVEREPSHATPRVPDVAPFAPILPVPTLVTPTPSLRQPVPLAVPSPAHSPELIRPRSRPASPVHSTDGWIPTADRNSSFIDLPPPHALSDPAATMLAPSPRSTTRSLDASVADASAPQHPTVRTRDYAYAPTTQPTAPARPPTATSQGSTRLSEFDLISPPHHRSHAASVRSGRTARENGRTHTLQREPSQPERIAEEWRRANPDMTSPQSSPTHVYHGDVR